MVKCFLGSSNIVLDNMKTRAASRVFQCKQVFSPEYKKSFNQDDVFYFAKEINEFSPDVIFVGLTAPKQEKLIANLKDHTSAQY